MVLDTNTMRGMVLDTTTMVVASIPGCQFVWLCPWLWLWRYYGWGWGWGWGYGYGYGYGDIMIQVGHLLP